MDYLIKQVTDVMHVLIEIDSELTEISIESYHRLAYLSLIETIVSDIRSAIVSRENIPDEVYKTLFVKIGALAMGILRKEYHFNSTRFAQFLLNKHKLYGPGPFEHWGHISAIVRLDSKIERLKNIFKNPELDDHGESSVDTLNDIIGYCVLGYYLKGVN